MKKILSLVLALMLVLSMTTAAFATTFEDLKEADAKLQDAADLLSGLKIIEGFPDGEFKAENGVTRAQMAVMIIKARGLGAIATDTPSFTDSQTHWAKGYIALASDLKIIEGKGNGIFDPDGAVTYEQAATMMLRALGYTNESINGGSSTAYNGANYRAKAIALNLFKDLTGFVMNEGANRGHIALMLNRNLSNGMVETNDRGRAEYIKSEDGKNITLLSQVAKREPALAVTSKVVADALTDISEYLYQNVVAYVVDDKVIYVEGSNSTVKTGKISDVTGATVSFGTGANKVDYTVKANDIKVFYNNAEVAFSNASIAQIKDSKATLVLDAAEKVVGIVANEETAGKFISSVYKKDSTSINGIALPTKTDGKVDLTKVTVTGAVDAIQDIAVNDVVKAYSAIGNAAVKLLVVRNSVEGKVTKANNDGTSVYIDAIGEYRDADIALKLKVLSEGTFYFDEEDAVFAFVGKSVAAPINYSMIVSAENGVYVGTSTIINNPTIDVLNNKGEEVTYTVAKDAKFDVLTFEGKDKSKDNAVYTLEANNVIELNSLFDAKAVVRSVTLKDGKVTKFVLQETKQATSAVAVNVKTFDPAANVVIFNYVDADTQSVNTLEQLVALKSVDAANFYYINTNSQYSLIMVVGKSVVKAAAPVAGLIAEQQKVVNADGKAVHEFVVYVDGEKHTYLSTVALGSEVIESGAGIVNITLTNGLVSKVTTNAAIETVVGSNADLSPITDIDSTKATFYLDDVKYYMATDATIYVVDKNETFVRIGDITDLESLNITVYVYINADNDKIVDTIVIKTK